MNWKKTRLSITRWESNGYRITEDAEIHGNPFKLEALGDEFANEPEYFPSLKAAQSAASLKNELNVVKQENARLRDELNMNRQAEAFERTAARQPAPVETPAVAAIAADLVKAMDRPPPERNGTAPHLADDSEYPF